MFASTWAPASDAPIMAPGGRPCGRPARRRRCAISVANWVSQSSATREVEEHVGRGRRRAAAGDVGDGRGREVGPPGGDQRRRTWSQRPDHTGLPRDAARPRRAGAPGRRRRRRARRTPSAPPARDGRPQRRAARARAGRACRARRPELEDAGGDLGDDPGARAAARGHLVDDVEADAEVEPAVEHRPDHHRTAAGLGQAHVPADVVAPLGALLEQRRRHHREQARAGGVAAARAPTRGARPRRTPGRAAW